MKTKFRKTGTRLSTFFNFKFLEKFLTKNLHISNIIRNFVLVKDNIIAHCNIDDFVAQLVEHYTFNVGVVESYSTEVTNGCVTQLDRVTAF